MIIKTHIKGTLVDPMNNPMPNAYIISIMSDKDGYARGMRATYKTNDKAEYDFYLVGGYHRLYTLINKDDIEKFIGLVHITENNRIYTLEEAIAVCK